MNSIQSSNPNRPKFITITQHHQHNPIAQTHQISEKSSYLRENPIQSTQAKIINEPNWPKRDQTQTNQSTHTNNKPTTTSESKPIHNHHHLGFTTPQPPTTDPFFTTPTSKTLKFSHCFLRIKTLWPPW